MPVQLRAINLPSKPGVYLFKDDNARVLYVGKATDLRDRIKSYFSKNPDRAMIPGLIAAAEDVDFVITNNPQEALILERQLVREHRPRYNSMLKDDKSYPFIVITKEEIPRLLYTRHPPKNSWIWGPFANAGAAKTVIGLLRRHLGLRDCKELLPEGCLSMYIGLCSGPCIEVGDYSQRVRSARDILDGQALGLIEEIAAEMDAASAEMDYEAAAISRDRIKAIRTVLSQQIISSTVYRDCDALGIAIQGDLAAIVVIHADDGIVKGQETWPMIHRGDQGQTISTFVADHYSSRRPPKLLLLPTPISEVLHKWLDTRRGGKVEVRVPRRGNFAVLRKMADQNASVQIDNLNRKRAGSLEQRAADDGAKLLAVNSLDHIVCFDMAQLQGEERVGASVVLRNGRPAKKEFRTYLVKGEAIDDLRMMREVVERWLKRQDQWPDLLLIDGGRTHLDIIEKLLRDHGLCDRLPLGCLAKREETLSRPNQPDLVLDGRGRVLVHARDEAHRFVNNFHRKRRSRNRLSDPLTMVTGLGAKKFQSLLRHFGGRQGIQHASVSELQITPGIGKSLAIRIYDALH